ncbi:MAG: threonine/serine dehydratase [Armatimonadota bacterium]|nr:threonine/serine dehydratase [Armatimonadota bacterium]
MRVPDGRVAGGTAPPTVADVRAAVSRIAGIARRTPVVCWDADGGMLLKLESLQPTGAFKVRGAANHLRAVAGTVPGVVTASSGNHGQAVAYVAQRLHIPAVVVVPETVNPVKARAIVGFGAELVRCGATMDERYAMARRLAAERGLHMVPSYDDALVIAGQGTCGLEIADQAPDVGAVVVPTSGGGLISGVALALKALRPAIKVIGAEPASLPRFAASRAVGEPTTVPFVDTVCDGLKAQRPGVLTWAVTSQAVDSFVAVPDGAVLEAVRRLCLEAHLIVEPSGAIGVAAILSGQVVERPALAVVSGGNLDPSLLATLVSPG